MRLVLGEGNPLAEWERLKPVSSELVTVECLRTIERVSLDARAHAAAELPIRRGAALRILDGFDLVALSPTVLDRAANPFPVYVATLDAIHLATAVLLREEHPDLDFATHDAKLALAARSMGFVVIGA
jgi:predicted nucleic acid-binding protein